MSDDAARILDALHDIQARLTAIEGRLHAADVALAEVRGVVGTAVDSLDGITERVGPAEVEARRAAAVTLLDVASRPEVLEALTTLARVAPALAAVAPALEGASGTFAAAADTFDHYAARAAEAGIDLDARGRTLLGAAERLTAPEAVRLLESALGHTETLQTLLDSPVVAPDAVRVVASAAEALVEVRSGASGQTGLFGAVGALSDADVQRAVDFGIRFARAFGRRLASSP